MPGSNLSISDGIGFEQFWVLPQQLIHTGNHAGREFNFLQTVQNTQSLKFGTSGAQVLCVPKMDRQRSLMTASIGLGATVGACSTNSRIAAPDIIELQL